MRQTLARFLKGINQNFDIKFSNDPERLYTLQNARLVKRGQAGFVTRIKGFVQWFSPAQYDSIGLLSVKGDVDTSDYLKGYRLFLDDTIYLQAEDPFIEQSGLIATLFLEEDFFVQSQRLNHFFTETIQMTEFVLKRTLPVIRFVENIFTIERFNVSDLIELDFVETLSLTDVQIDNQSTVRFFEAFVS